MPLLLYLYIYIYERYALAIFNSDNVSNFHYTSFFLGTVLTAKYNLHS
jgi:hypothetical protein